MGKIISYHLSMQISYCLVYKIQIQDTQRGVMAEFVKQTLRMLCEWRSIEMLEMNVKEDHIHVILSIPLRIIDI